ncbi:Endoplasmic reticulum lectin 1 [Clonorchis sinensis]|uniref:Endoplasmic reticulum lectin 1 n=1 Tax=Clonorchis sinensis TaxID=79923 RepID=A0A8T1MNE3_CLOSI|nr:Endoplasmic reticulum lectin 1 [Clonorchis sinensis]
MYTFGSIFTTLLLCRLCLSSYEISDEILYKVRWSKDGSEDRPLSQNILISTSAGEKFECLVPTAQEFPEVNQLDSNATANEEVILEQLFEARPCSTRAEFYWSYELCHKNYVRQFHEELLPDKSSKTQEYFLGYHKKEVSAGSPHSASRPGILLGGSSYPYYVVKYVDGTPCDLTGERRVTSVLYICLEDEDGRIIQVSEVESCQYQVVFATRYLCSHPAYRLPKRPVKPLSCAPREGAIAKPASLLEFEKQQEQLSQHGISNLAALFGNVALKNIRVEANRRNNLIVYRIRTIDADESNETNEETMSQEDTSSSDEDSANRGDTGKVATPAELSSKPTVPGNAYRTRFLEFLSGKFCLQGRTSGWWQYEICLRSNVTQYHVNNQGKRAQTILLGQWDQSAHERWSTKQAGNSISYVRSSAEGVNLFYGNGEFCELIKQARETIVKLKCNAAANGIHLSFSERTECRYTVLVESSAFCELTTEEIKSLVY